MIPEHVPHAMELFGKRYAAGQFRPFYVPREYMPQVDAQFLPQLIHEAVADGYKVAIRTKPPEMLRAHQRIDHARALSMAPDVRMKPILISVDGYVLDGNHRWWSHVHEGSPFLSAIDLGVPFDEGIAYLLARPYTYTIQPDTPERN